MEESSSVGRESITLLSKHPQYIHFIDIPLSSKVMLITRGKKHAVYFLISMIHSTLFSIMRRTGNVKFN